MPKFNTLSTRFILLFCAITVPLLSILYLAGNFTKGVVLTQVANSYQNLVSSSLNMIDRSLDDIAINMMDIVNHDDNFQRFGQPGLSDSEYYFAQIGLIQRNSMYQSYYHTVDMFFVYSKPSDMLVSTNMAGATPSYYEPVRAWITESFHHPEQLKKVMYKWNIIRIKDQNFLYRLVSDDLTNNAYIGALINVNSLKMPLGNLNLRKGGDLLFLGNDGGILSDPSSSLSSLSSLPAEQLSQNHSFSYTSEKTKYLVVTNHSKNSPMSTAVVIPNSELLQGLSGFQTITRWMPLVVFAILLLYGFIFRSMIFKPILQLLGAIRRIKDGKMEARLPDSNIAEFAIINHTFNGMVEEITDLKIGVYEERLRAQKAEMKQLQTQINPHFFLNALNIVFQLADLKRVELVKKMVRHLVQYFRFMIRVNKETITLEQEMEHIRNYLEIQKMRYQDDFEFDIAIQDDLQEACLPSLFIQPFVENAMIHGLSLKAAPFRLTITARRNEEQQDQMIIEICDNGKGMAGEKLAQLNAPEYLPDSDEEGHIGIWNVKKRLAMRYSDRAAIIFRHLEPSGISVNLTLPIEYA
ncbi:sensor histidine kinase [Paenibacillus albus]|uniref:Helicase Ski2 n=1 Tax=Paenibacillus albus TaxID=2495582 RepID=A0A3Q8X3R2_9BACL|nr:histidine kinase [Paenibacillus albus]AZN39783.1 helicase Ski2 [Paenibacillus albus]